ncbi:ABC transporter transmembrane domain-containing protein, partial [Bacillus velezensis]|uniref:ABC transporter transmembrane domain-containing protein n=1 Tax=Bacillus velezensis TaxID=492670 RepID=UPI0011A58994
TISLILYITPLLTFITLFIIPIILFTIKSITNPTRFLFKHHHKNLPHLNPFIQHSISRPKVIKPYSTEHPLMKQFLQKNAPLQSSAF